LAIKRHIKCPGAALKTIGSMRTINLTDVIYLNMA